MLAICSFRCRNPVSRGKDARIIVASAKTKSAWKESCSPVVGAGEFARKTVDEEFRFVLGFVDDRSKPAVLCNLIARDLV